MTGLQFGSYLQVQLQVYKFFKKSETLMAAASPKSDLLAAPESRLGCRGAVIIILSMAAGLLALTG